jgi:hypothetical protein
MEETEQELYRWRRLMYEWSQDDPELVPHLAAVGLRCRAWADALQLDLEERCLVEAAGYLHDIGKVSSLGESGFHPIDSALFAEEHNADSRLCALIAHHSGARYEAELAGVDIPYLGEESPLSDILSVSNMTVDPKGNAVSLDERRREIKHRYGRESDAVIALDRYWPELLLSWQRLHKLLDRSFPDEAAEDDRIK